ncbi:MAG: Eco57I restriction-modification methylase domain-containing protein [Rhodanobacter sp.]
MTLLPSNAIRENHAASEAVHHFSGAGTTARGAVFTRTEIVEFILDLVGYTEDRPLATLRLLEPAAGHADFLVPVIGRLVRSFLAYGGKLPKAGTALADAIVAFDAHASSVIAGREVIAAELQRHGVSTKIAANLAERWLRTDDFLATSLTGLFDFVVGNPPYVRQELIPETLLARYRARFSTLYDRADLYVLFYERGLDVLAPGGKLGFICTDRWTKNKYGGPLRQKIAEQFTLTHFVDLVGTAAFLTDVLTYPAITVIERPSVLPVTQPTRLSYRPEIRKDILEPLAAAMTAPVANEAAGVSTMKNVMNGAGPWLLHEPERLALVRRLEKTWLPLEDAGCKVGIGVATGSDRVYIAPMQDLDVEPSRRLPIVRTQDIRGGTVDWQGLAVLNPFDDDGKLIDLNDYPRFARHMRLHEATIRARNVAQKNPTRWFRTIDRIYPELMQRPKLLIPDIKGDAHIVYEEGLFYPHHNLYFITSDEWDLHALQAVLMSGIARLFVTTYSTKMSGGFLRFQAQYLRRIRVPRWDQVSPVLRKALHTAAIAKDLEAANCATFELYGLNAADQALIGSA